ncbi:hypothetical protein LCGC14_0646700 [marine sediment metagenome]|uniref:CUT domain-containing protein n=1 Tax=marine sediment metagenome TaxID=412755 RepID=A0A0F9R2P3_9ZZZZ|nr:DUF559 domain-containing protein [Pricia sp.]
MIEISEKEAERRRKISIAMKGRVFTDDHKRKMSETRIARNIKPWNKGKKQSEETKKKMKDWWAIPENKKKVIEQRIGKSTAKKGQTLPDELKKRISDSLKGEKCYWYGKKLSKEHRKKLSIAGKGRKHGLFTEAHKRKISEAHKKLWQQPEYVKKKKKEWGIKPTKPEMMLFDLLNELYPNEWKYTGDFSFMINGKNPDFVNCNGKKLIIEMFGDYWHKGEDPKDRAKVFEPFGYETLVIWERELKDPEKVISKIVDFVEHTEATMYAVK